MRLSLDPGDPGYLAWAKVHAAGRQVMVTVDGKPVRAIMADDDMGVAVVYREDSRGQLVLTPRRDAVERDVVRGVVEIEILEGAD